MNWILILIVFIIGVIWFWQTSSWDSWWNKRQHRKSKEFYNELALEQ